MNKNRLSSEFLTQLKKEGMFLDDTFVLHNGFTGEHKVLEILEHEYPGGQVGFRLKTKSRTGVHLIEGHDLVNAFLINDKFDSKQYQEDLDYVIESKTGTFCPDEIPRIIADSERLHTLLDTSCDYTFPYSIVIVGAILYEDMGDDYYGPEFTLLIRIYEE